MGSFLETKINYIIAKAHLICKRESIYPAKHIQISKNDLILKIRKIIAELTTLLI
jgi:hypothetical protein